MGRGGRCHCRPADRVQRGTSATHPARVPEWRFVRLREPTSRGSGSDPRTVPPDAGGNSPSLQACVWAAASAPSAVKPNSQRSGLGPLALGAACCFVCGLIALFPGSAGGLWRLFFPGISYGTGCVFYELVFFLLNISVVSLQLSLRQNN